ncbi:MAG: glycosyltransferase family 2 protein, partial [Solirubrobacterales bacterium]
MLELPGDYLGRPVGAAVVDGDHLEVDYPDLEVIAIDDGSPDGTARIVTEKLAHDPRLRFLEKKVNEGKAMAMN